MRQRKSIPAWSAFNHLLEIRDRRLDESLRPGHSHKDAALVRFQNGPQQRVIRHWRRRPAGHAAAVGAFSLDVRYLRLARGHLHDARIDLLARLLKLSQPPIPIGLCPASIARPEIIKNGLRTG